MKKIKISKSDKTTKGTITLSGSKSISNRVLIIRALAEGDFDIHNLSDSDDTKTLSSLLKSEDYKLDAHHAGTTFRFMTAYLSTLEGENILTGSERMQERPIRALVDALKSMGANISYTHKEGYPPLKIGTPFRSLASEVDLQADISSQYISALLMVAPTLPDGLRINLKGEIVSRPYLEMTLRIMEHFGVSHQWEDQSIIIAPQKYIAKDFFVEADWSAASYYYIIAGLSNKAEITLNGLQENSLQGDRAIAEIGSSFGIKTTFDNQSITITKQKESAEYFEYDFIKCPDIAQSVCTLAAGMGNQGLFSGLQTLKIKETNRIIALQTELMKVNVFLSKLPPRFSKNSDIEYFMLDGSANDDLGQPSFDTYDDHRMAMCLAPMALLFPVELNDPMVVSKSYPDFWNHLEQIGFEIENIT